jgi:hypothetical protein
VILNISIADGLYQTYAEMPGYHRPHQAIAETLKRFAHINPSDARAMTITGETRNELERLSGSTIDSAEDLIKVMARLATLKLDGYEIALPEDVTKYYVGQAEFFSREPREWIQEKVVDALKKGAGA